MNTWHGKKWLWRKIKGKKQPLINLLSHGTSCQITSLSMANRTDRACLIPGTCLSRSLSPLSLTIYLPFCLLLFPCFNILAHTSMSLSLSVRHTQACVSRHKQTHTQTHQHTHHRVTGMPFLSSYFLSIWISVILSDTPSLLSSAFPSCPERRSDVPFCFAFFFPRPFVNFPLN